MCAIFGIAGEKEASKLTYLGLHALQHRGQEGAGIVSSNGEAPLLHSKQGLVGDIFDSQVLDSLKGFAAIGHTRYSTTGGNNPSNLQPILMKSALGWTALAHNGNLVNANKITKELEQRGSIFQSTIDTEVIIHLMACSGETDLPAALISALNKVQGAYSLLLLSQQYLIAARDPYGFWPLVLGKINSHPVFASESNAFKLIGAKYQREVAAGEIIIVPLSNPQKLECLHPFPPREQKRCVFEYIYFARPDSFHHGESVHVVRKLLGERLAEEQPAPKADVVIPIPDSGVPAAIGFAARAQIPFDMGIIRSHYIGRTFIEPSQAIRDFGVKLKLNPVVPCIKGKSVVVIDDSLVRGTTSKKIISHLRECGAREVHVRISAPPTAYPCYYGIDTPTSEELMASHNTVEGIREFIKADTLGYLSLEGLIDVISQRVGQGFCHACFSGQYPVHPTDMWDQ